MQKRTLGKSNLEVSAFGLGCMGMSFSFGPLADKSPVLDMTIDLDGVPAGYAAMDEHFAIKVMVRP